MHEEFIDVSAGRHAVLDFGGTGEPVLFLHQVASNAQVWSPVGEHMPGSVRAVALDLAAHGHTLTPEESVAAARRGLVEVVTTLGLDHPFLVLESEELIALFESEFRALEPRGIMVIAPLTALRGEEAAAEFADFMGTDSLGLWEERTEVFASGSADDKQAFIDRRTDRALADWNNAGVSAEQLRAFIERGIRDTATGWERTPRREFVVPALDAICAAGPLGLDLYDRVPCPTWLVLGLDDAQDEGDDTIAAFRSWATEKPGRAVRFLPGHVGADSFDPAVLARTITEAVAAAGDSSAVVASR